MKKDSRQEGRKYASNTEITNAPVSEADQAEQGVVGSDVAEVIIRNLYFILQSDPRGECALFISVIEDDTTAVLQKGMKWEEGEVAQLCPTLCDPMDCAHQAPPSMGFSRQEYWSGSPFPSPGDLPNPGIKHGSPAL